MSATRDREEEIFDAAREISAHERAAFLAEKCGPDADLRQRIEGMLEADAAAGEFFKTHGAPSPTVILAGASLSPSIEKPGDRIGHYKLLLQIGEGGCGVVYMSEQEEPVRRRVALKVIKLGRETKQVIARFEAEGQALALMDHPNIVKIFDAGITDAPLPASGHPLPVGRGEGQGEGSANSQPSTFPRPPLLCHGTGPRCEDHRVLRPEATFHG